MRYLLLTFSMLLVLGGCSGSAKIKHYSGPPVTRVYIDKSDRVMHLLNGKKILKTYKVGLGFDPAGHKRFEGDGRTPEGFYRIDRRNPNSDFHLSLGISYPNTLDFAAAIALGKDPGGEIFIHGASRNPKNKGRADWTAGCISVSDKEIEEIYAMVRNGTLIDIRP